METGRTVEVVGPPWLMMIIIAGVSLLGVVVTAVIGPIVVERFKSGRTTPESPEFSVITSLLAGVPLALIANRLLEHANADQARRPVPV